MTVQPVCSLAIAITAVWSASAPPAAADARSPYAPDPVPTALSTSAAWLLAGTGFVLSHEGLVPDLREYTSDKINALDRLVIGPKRDTSAAISDVLLFTLVSAPYALDAIDVAIAGGDATSWANDSLVMLQTQGVAAAVTQLVKLGVQRARPYTYQSGFLAADRDDVQSFFSGHSSLAFTSAVAYGTTYSRRHSDASEPWMWAGLLTMATSVAVLRVHARKHFWTDVLTGAAVGALVGWLVPHLQERNGADDGVETQSGAFMLRVGGGL